MPGRLYDATWGRAFAWGYDAFQRRSCEAGMEAKRHEGNDREGKERFHDLPLAGWAGGVCPGRPWP